MPDTSLANIERWAAGIPVPAYAIDDQTAIKVVDGTVDVVSEGHWKLFTPARKQANPASPVLGAVSDRRCGRPWRRRPRDRPRSGCGLLSGVLPAVLRRGVGDAAGARAAVHPYVLDAELCALAHRLVGDLGPGSDHHRLDAAGAR